MQGSRSLLIQSIQKVRESVWGENDGLVQMAGGCGSWEDHDCQTDVVGTNSRFCVFFFLPTAYAVIIREYLFQTWFKHTWLTGSHDLCKKCCGV